MQQPPENFHSQAAAGELLRLRGNSIGKKGAIGETGGSVAQISTKHEGRAEGLGALRRIYNGTADITLKNALLHHEKPTQQP